MTVKIIVGYLRLMQRILHQQQLDLVTLGVEKPLVEAFYQYLGDDQNYTFDVDQYSQLLQRLQSQFDQPISLVLANQVALQDVGLMGYLASTSLNLEQALALLNQFYPLLYKQTQSESLQIDQQVETINIHWCAVNPEWREFYELNLALLCKLADSIVQDELIPPDYIHVGYTPRFALHHYEQFFNTHIRVIPQKYGVQFPKHILQTRSMSADWQLNQVLSHQAQQSLQAQYGFSQQQSQFKQKIIRLIEQGLNQPISLLSYIAHTMHLSERTLQRQLKHYNLNFQAILDEYRIQKSKDYLQKNISLTEIAERLDYADQSAFGRAFKRWTGQTPKQYLKDIQDLKE